MLNITFVLVYVRNKNLNIPTNKDRFFSNILSEFIGCYQSRKYGIKKKAHVQENANVVLVPAFLCSASVSEWFTSTSKSP